MICCYNNNEKKPQCFHCLRRLLWLIMVTRFYLAHFPSVDTAGQSVSVAHKHRQQGAPLLLNHLRTQFDLKEENIQITLLINFGFIVFLKSPKIIEKKNPPKKDAIRLGHTSFLNKVIQHGCFSLTPYPQHTKQEVIKTKNNPKKAWKAENKEQKLRPFGLTGLIGPERAVNDRLIKQTPHLI